MRAVVLSGRRKVEVKTVPRPTLLHDDDVIVKVMLAGLCGSDLHPYRGDETGCDLGSTIMGHECVPLLSCVCVLCAYCMCAFCGSV